jgi:hypothetical protein
VIDIETALLQQFFNIAQRQRIAKIPPDRTEYESGFGLPPFEDRGSGYHFAILSRHQPAALKVATHPFEVFGTHGWVTFSIKYSWETSMFAVQKCGGIVDPVTSAIVAKATSDISETAKEGGKSFLHAVLAPPGEALGGLFADKVNERRHANLIKIAARAQERLKAAGATPKQVPLSIIHPALEAASLEEDPDLQGMWATLLASAADPTNERAEAIRSYLSVLRDLTPNEVKFLNAWYETFVGNTPGVTEFSRAYITDRRFILAELLPIYTDSVVVTYQGVGSSHIEVTVENLSAMLAVLVRHSLVAKLVDDESIARIEPFASSVSDPTTYTLTDFGAMFIAACRGSITVA